MVRIIFYRFIVSSILLANVLANFSRLTKLRKSFCIIIIIYCYYYSLHLNKKSYQSCFTIERKSVTFLSTLKAPFSSYRNQSMKLHFNLSVSGYIFRFTFRSLPDVSPSDKCRAKNVLSVY